jgi:hypothetical protein
VDFDEILYVADDAEDDLHSVLLNLIAQTIPKWWTFKLLRWAQLLNRLVDLDEILYGGDAIEDDLYSVLHNRVASSIPCVMGAQGNPCTATTSDVFCFVVSLLIFPESSTRAPWQLNSRDV